MHVSFSIVGWSRSSSTIPRTGRLSHTNGRSNLWWCLTHYVSRDNGPSCRECGVLVSVLQQLVVNTDTIASTMGRFAVATEHDQSATAWIASLLSLFYSTLSLFARYYLKSGTVALDDAAIVVAQVLAFAQFGTTFYGISQGLGKDLSLLGPSQQNHSANVRWPTKIGIRSIVD